MNRRNGPSRLAGALVVIFPALLAIAATLAFSAPAAQAQQDKETVSDVDPAARPPQAARPPVDAGKAADAAAAPRPRRSYLGWLYESLGLLYSVIFLVLSFALVAFFVMNLLIARRESVLPSDLIEGFESLLNAKKYQEAYELAKNDESFLGHVLSAGLARVSSGYEKAIEAMQEVGEDENMRLEHRLSYLALIGTIAPMFGLLGTVDGMVQAFEVIRDSATSPKPNELAAGIATALVTTLVGLWLAIPAVIVFNILRNRIGRLVLEVGIISENLMSRFQNVGTKAP